MQPDPTKFRYYVEDTLLLRFLIKRYTEMLRIDEPNLVPVWKGLGLAGLYQNKEFGNAFSILISSSSYTSAEVITSSIDLFLAELDRLQVADVADYVEKKVEGRPMSPGTAKQLLRWSWLEGRKMRKERNFEFYPVWELMAWLALDSDERVAEFEEKCRFSESPPKEKLENGLDVLREPVRKSMTKKQHKSCFAKISDPLPDYCWKPAPPRIDKETQK